MSDSSWERALRVSSRSWDLVTDIKNFIQFKLSNPDDAATMEWYMAAAVAVEAIRTAIKSTFTDEEYRIIRDASSHMVSDISIPVTDIKA
jgi:hypothetical protein